jgi:hypothetical protein
MEKVVHNLSYHERPWSYQNMICHKTLQTHLGIFFRECRVGSKDAIIHINRYFYYSEKETFLTAYFVVVNNFVKFVQY